MGLRLTVPRLLVIVMTYHITIRTYGTWLHGDPRGSVDRQNNQYGEPLLEPSTERLKYARRLMKHSPCVFNQQQQCCVQETFNEVAAHRGWTILALDVLSNHAHIVITVPDEITPSKILTDLKSRATRMLREQGLIEPEREIWEPHGSTPKLIREREIQAACEYVHNQRNHIQP